MPTYEYKCDACSHAFEQFHSMTADPIRKCPACKKLKVKRLIGTGAGLIFKGSGFYITDYRDQSYKDKAKAESGSTSTDAGSGTAAAGGDGKPAGGAESKPAATADAKATPAAAATAPAASTTSSPSKGASKDSGKKRK